jgi:hypothetical protein
MVSTLVAVCTERPSSAITATASKRPLGHHLAYELGCPAVDGRFRLQFDDPSSCCHQLGLVPVRRPRQLPSVNEVLTAPNVDRLFTDAEVVSNLPD